MLFESKILNSGPLTIGGLGVRGQTSRGRVGGAQIVRTFLHKKRTSGVGGGVFLPPSLPCHICIKICQCNKLLTIFVLHLASELYVCSSQLFFYSCLTKFFFCIDCESKFSMFVSHILFLPFLDIANIAKILYMFI